MENIDNVIKIPRLKTIAEPEEIHYEDLIGLKTLEKDGLLDDDDEDIDEGEEAEDEGMDEGGDIDDDIDDEDIEQELGVLEKSKEKVKTINGKKVIIDRDQENKDVAHFQSTGDEKTLEKIYLSRIPTIKFWAKKHYYPGLALSEEDLFGELSIVFVKAIKHYKINKGSFNTCLYTFFLNRLKNIKSGVHAKKRISSEYEGPTNGMILSLDYSYTDKSGSEVTLKDVIPSDCQDPYSQHSYEDILDLMAEGNPLVKGFLDKVGQGESVSTLLKEIRVIYGKKGHSTVSKAIKALKKNKTYLVSKIKQLN